MVKAERSTDSKSVAPTRAADIDPVNSGGNVASPPLLTLDSRRDLGQRLVKQDGWVLQGGVVLKTQQNQTQTAVVRDEKRGGSGRWLGSCHVSRGVHRLAQLHGKEWA